MGKEDVAFENKRREYLNYFSDFRITEEGMKAAKHTTPDCTELLPRYFSLLVKRNKLDKILKKYEDVFEKMYQIKIRRNGKHIENIKDLTNAERSILPYSSKTSVIIESPLQQKNIICPS